MTYCSIEENEVVIHLCEVIEYTSTCLTFIDYITSEVTKYYFGCSEFAIVQESEDVFGVVSKIKADKKITSSDFNIIFKAPDRTDTYRRIRALRDIGFTTETSITEGDLVKFKQNIIRVIGEDLAEQISEVRNDDDLSESECDQLVNICSNVHKQFTETVRSSTSIKDIISNWPNILSIDKPYLRFLMDS